MPDADEQRAAPDRPHERARRTPALTDLVAQAYTTARCQGGHRLRLQSRRAHNRRILHVTRTSQRLPNFFLAGVSRAGTTSLHGYLHQHPQIFMSPVKEPHFFGAGDLLRDPHRDEVLSAVTRNRAALTAYLEGPQEPVNFRLIVQWEDYLRLFRDSRDELVVGESSTGYLWLPSAPSAISAKVPEARVAFMLRDPAERLFTLYLQHIWEGRSTTFPAWFEATLDTPRHSASTIGAGRYATHLQRFFDVFPREQLRVHLYEDYRTAPRDVLRDLFAFLEVAPEHPIDLSARQRQSLVPRYPRLHGLRRRLLGGASLPRWVPQRLRRTIWRMYHGRPTGHVMEPADRRMAIDFYRDEIRRTGELIGRDLAAWLR